MGFPSFLLPDTDGLYSIVLWMAAFGFASSSSVFKDTQFRALTRSYHQCTEVILVFQSPCTKQREMSSILAHPVSLLSLFIG